MSKQPGRPKADTGICPDCGRTAKLCASRYWDGRHCTACTQTRWNAYVYHVRDRFPETAALRLAAALIDLLADQHDDLRRCISETPPVSRLRWEADWAERLKQRIDAALFARYLRGELAPPAPAPAPDCHGEERITPCHGEERSDEAISTHAACHGEECSDDAISSGEPRNAQEAEPRYRFRWRAPGGGVYGGLPGTKASVERTLQHHRRRWPDIECWIEPVADEEDTPCALRSSYCLRRI